MVEPSAKHLEFLADERLSEARVLLRARHYSGAYYLAGYAIECGLKVIIAKTFRAKTIPDPATLGKVYTHDLAKLVDAAKLRKERLTKENADPAFAANWAIVVEWREDSRYRRVTATEARDLIEAVDHPSDGVLAWVRTFW